MDLVYLFAAALLLGALLGLVIGCDALGVHQ